MSGKKIIYKMTVFLPLRSVTWLMQSLIVYTVSWVMSTFKLLHFVLICNLYVWMYVCMFLTTGWASRNTGDMTGLKLTSKAPAWGPCFRGTTWSQSCCLLMLRELLRDPWVTIRTSWAQSSISRCKSSGRLLSWTLIEVPVYVPILLLLLLAWAWASPITGWWEGVVDPAGGCCDWL